MRIVFSIDETNITNYPMKCAAGWEFTSDLLRRVAAAQLFGTHIPQEVCVLI